MTQEEIDRRFYEDFKDVLEDPEELKKVLWNGETKEQYIERMKDIYTYDLEMQESEAEESNGQTDEEWWESLSEDEKDGWVSFWQRMSGDYDFYVTDPVTGKIYRG